MTHEDRFARLLDQMSPPMDETGVWEQIEDRARTKRRMRDLRMLLAVRGRIYHECRGVPKRSRRKRTSWALALGFTCIVVAGAAFLGAYMAVEYSGRQARLVFVDFMPTPPDAAAGWGIDDPSGLVVVAPVMGTAVLEKVKNPGSITRDEDGASRLSGKVEVYRLSMSQPAVGGSMEITSEEVTRLDGGIDIQGSWVLRSGQGTWEGSSWTGIVTREGADRFYIGKADGAGAFEGLMLLLQWHVTKTAGPPVAADGTSETITVSGWIQSKE